MINATIVQVGDNGNEIFSDRFVLSGVPPIGTYIELDSTAGYVKKVSMKVASPKWDNYEMLTVTIDRHY